MTNIKLTDFIDVVTDCSRRDLCINAMAKTEDGTIIDPFNGCQDIEDKVLRHVSGAFADDPVRVLRIARFNARFGNEWKVAHETRCLVAEMIDNNTLDELTPERIWKELKQVLEADNSEIFFECLFDLGALHVIFPELQNIDIDALRDLDICRTLNEKVALLHNLSESNDIVELMERLKAPSSVNKFLELQDKLLAVLMPRFNTVNNLNQMVLEIVNTNKVSQRNFGACLEHIGNLPLQFCDLGGFTNTMMLAFLKCKSVNFDSLSRGEQTTLVGSQIGERLLEIKLNEVASLMF